MKKRVPVLIPFLVFVSLLFIGILIFAYVETKKANPQMIEVEQVCHLHARCMTLHACGLDSGDEAFCCAGCENVYAILLRKRRRGLRPELSRDRPVPAEPQAGADFERGAGAAPPPPDGARRARRSFSSRGCGAPPAAG